MQNNLATPRPGKQKHFSEYLDGAQVSKDVKDHLTRYYTAVDTRGSHEEYAGSFTEDAVLTLPTGFKVRGRDALRLLHQDLWRGDVERRKHTPSKAFTSGDDAAELVILGVVEYWTKDGQYTKKDMISHFDYRRESTTGAVEVCALAVWLS
ncbi:hypothetical protein LTR10_015267 [Elasticomyces elasticus]|uniref:SnoaL-like domain-containing protein n=1 Tax=Exophiala sideris TaxID=1016849 RepID=A0ABR0JEA8_9EURO|nr:hypothetical protein LTR10_015267 [Elasticomyces elasticus]KAK5032742.1 hypothetical protein LTS07_004152 [Exophiala sideris]KAK5037078.1 hypothetical protein LTR13_004883 [Exophiala sideris]KAK5062266.1 hypothetical protein LTR69_004624 [Exophiala sideris]KAK5182236.1 hypothetical protein LTR44_005247 [Eurotiomycetes sp. CCFEE 6388]